MKKLCKVLALVLVMTLILGALPANAAKKDSIHIKGLDATCTEAGYATAFLFEDGYHWSNSSKPEHLIGDGSEEAYLAWIAEGGKGYEAPLGHDFQYSETVAPTCLEDGYDIYKCSRCEETEQRNEVEALGHNYRVLVKYVAPTCTRAGKMSLKCTRCDDIKTTELAARGHNFIRISTVKPTCTKAGYDIYMCTRCWKTEKRNEVPALDHNFSKLIRSKAATCTEDGYELYKCSRCWKTNTIVLEALDHDFQLSETVAPTCIDAGYDIFKCSRCEETEQRNEIAATGLHTFPEEANKGTTFICEVCGGWAKGHDHKTAPAADATVTYK